MIPSMTDLLVLCAVPSIVSVLIERLETVCFFPVILPKDQHCAF